MKRIVLILLCFACGLLASYASGEDAKLASNARIVAMHVEAQSLREKHGLPEQELDERCCRIAQRWANRMAKEKHMRHGGGEQIIARGYPTVRKCFSAWMNSSGHRAWVLCKKDLCGWGCQKSSSGQWYYAGVFRARLAKKAEVDSSPETTKAGCGQCKESDCNCGTRPATRRRAFGLRR